MNRSMHFLYFKKIYILCLFGCLAPLEASTSYNLICTTERSHKISYIDKVNEKNELTQTRSKYKEDINKDYIKSSEKFKVSYNLKNNSGFIENNPAKAIRIFAPEPFEYAPIFLYYEVGELGETRVENEYGEIIAADLLKVNRWNIRIENPTDSSTSFFSIKSLEDKESAFIIDNSDELINDNLTEKYTHEISEGRCFQIK